MTPKFGASTMARPLGKSKVVHVHPMKSERHSEKAHRCIDCGNRLKDAFRGLESCACGTQNFCTSTTDRKTNRIVYVTTHYTL